MGVYRHAGLTDQHKASFARRRDARALREASRWRGAMYMLGYAIECRLKARLMERYRMYHLAALEKKLTERLGVPVDLRTHSIAYLFELTEANNRLSDGIRRDYNVCVRWRVDWRYDPDAGNMRDCDEFFECGDRFMKFIDSSV